MGPLSAVVSILLVSFTGPGCCSCPVGLLGRLAFFVGSNGGSEGV